METERVDLVVVGAGLYGITAAITYHKLHPDARLLVLEASPSIGGPWAPHRTFPGLKTNNLWGTYQHPDTPMSEERFGVKKGEHVPAEKVHEYLQALIDDNGIDSLIRLNTKVDTAEKIAGGWKLSCISSTGEGKDVQILTNKLILSTGLANRPSMPRYAVSPEFQPPIIHSASFPSHYSEIVAPNKHTLIIGAGKSAWDIAYACATNNGTATMLIRPTGKGPLWMSPPYVTPFKLWLEKLVFTRFFGLMSPCPWASNEGFEGVARRFLHGTWLGRKIVTAFWNVLGEDVVSLNRYNEHEETKKLRPWRNAFEVGNALSIMNYPTDWFELVREGKIKIIIADVERVEAENEAILSTGEKLQVDAVVSATGWETHPSIKFLPVGIEKELGLPTKGQVPSAEEKELMQKAENELYTRYPFLKERDSNKLYHPDPSHRNTVKTSGTEGEDHPFRLYRFMVPPSDLADRSIGFVGAMMTLGSTFCAYLQALWLVAYFDGTLSLPSTSASEIKYETFLETEYCRMRHAMGYGNKFPDLVFDALPYLDVLMKDLGFEEKRKGGFKSEYFGSYGPEDYRGLVELYMEKHKLD
ncbi:FAD/NAD(P)-binding domain-containing protein [Sporormia fimetaria CBS 119925]|uniref:FAD/NAD(P)-binding domain-containing protein n=1 Tax=Sporormia fimetaria CBS 119925 TaxID=1340428 RepID=A0A6A6VM41_9PLEO|nr:FAD/NAD(P)-binding domain-containing protein [Sporormia fimetaria CBS 119925]